MEIKQEELQALLEQDQKNLTEMGMKRIEILMKELNHSPKKTDK